MIVKAKKPWEYGYHDWAAVNIADCLNEIKRKVKVLKQRIFKEVYTL